MTERRLVAAVDLGGTKIRSLIVDPAGAIYGVDQRPTEAELGPVAVVERIVDSIRRALTAASAGPEELLAIGVAAPGPVDFERGLVLEAPNLPAWVDVPLAALVAERFDRPAVLENDANAAAVGEHRLGAGRGVRHLIYLTISTGIGGGLILDGKLYRGADGTAGELGHVIIDERGPLDDCGLRGCLEVLASGTAIARMAQEVIHQSPALRQAALVAGELTSREVHLAAQAGDPTALAVLARAAHALALGLASFINSFNPELFVVGGGASAIRDLLIDPAFDKARRLAFARPSARARLLPAALGADSGALGAAVLALEAVDRTR